MPSSITINGRLCADPELKESTNGSVYAKVRIADDGYGREPIFWSGMAWDAASKIFQSAKKGSSMMLICTLEPWKDEDEKTRQPTLKILAGSYDSSGKKKEGDGLPF